MSIKRFRKRHGTASLVVAVIAVVLALTGGAYAANSALSGKQKKEVEKIAKKYAGQPGKQGAAGATGPAGPAGAKGDKGDAGAPGSSGSNGKGVTVAIEAPGLNCAEGGIAVEVEGSGAKRYVCNGEEGEEGQTGFAAQLPSGKTEKGAWTTDAAAEGQTTAYATISFPYPTPVGGYEVIYVPEETTPAGCPGSYEEPKAEAGKLCIYEVDSFGTAYQSAINPETDVTGAHAGQVGAILKFSASALGGFARGSWAATAG